jgi:acyl-CoA reductase-like NAD-dependent aldehyde dehydrogenase
MTIGNRICAEIGMIIVQDGAFVKIESRSADFLDRGIQPNPQKDNGTELARIIAKQINSLADHVDEINGQIAKAKEDGVGVANSRTPVSK